LHTAIVLDDQLVQSDDSRLEWFRTLLAEKAQSFQIVDSPAGRVTTSTRESWCRREAPFTRTRTAGSYERARSDPKSHYRDWYVWSKKKPRTANSGIVFPGVQKSTWDYDPAAKAYYYHRFYDFQPDLNTSNPYVQAEILKIMGFWLQLGVSGFRMDAVPFVIAEKGSTVTKPNERYDMLRTFSQFISWREGDAIILAEANVLPGTDMKYFGDSGERLHMMFNFEAINISSMLWQAVTVVLL
jgi:glycosidase